MSVRLLLLDDDANIRETAKDILEDAGYAVESASSIAGALEILRRLSCQIALVDLHLPDGTGLEFAHQARALQPRLPVVLMSGEAAGSSSLTEDALEAGLTKPVDPQDLLQTLEKILHRPPSSAAG